MKSVGLERCDVYECVRWRAGVFFLGFWCGWHIRWGDNSSSSSSSVVSTLKIATRQKVGCGWQLR